MLIRSLSVQVQVNPPYAGGGSKLIYHLVLPDEPREEPNYPLCMHACVCLRVCVCVCVCVRERERETDRQTDTQRQRQREDKNLTQENTPNTHTNHLSILGFGMIFISFFVLFPIF